MDNSLQTPSPPAESLEEAINRHPPWERPMWLGLAEQHFRQAADLEVLRELRVYRVKYHLT